MDTLAPPFLPARPTNGGRWRGSVPIPGDWVIEPKLNGWRAWVHTPTQTVFNRYGVKLSISDVYRPVLEQLSSTPFEWLDAEALERRHNILKGSLAILDTPISGDYDERQNALFIGLCRLPAFLPLPAYTVPTKDTNKILSFAYTFSERDNDPDLQPNTAWHRLQAVNKELGCEFHEGFVAKKRNAPYPKAAHPDDETTDWVKFRWNNA